MPIYAVTYEYEPSTQTFLNELRHSHRSYLRGLNAQGKLISSGHLRDATFAGALLLMHTATAREAQELLEKDPFFSQGLVRRIIIREWEPTIGDMAEKFETPADFPQPNP
ncbi:YciI family protein [Gleimia hominis]|uniref:YciI family protein n=1 Tax=Gleimia hominis TaxID=595468 RepID=UPI000C803D5F|nr:YciI family protein [Gleimia hominis]WIK65014.1 YciI family protein [Gleimia hominis]